ncbi:MAG: ATP-binding cassette domain-containing protein [Candidatus Dormiibacterota bacterium]
MGSNGLAIVTEGLTKRFGDATALAGLDLTVPSGIVQGLLGPNGAGKTTAVRILATLLRLDSGRAEVAGFDVQRQAALVRSHVGLVGQSAAVDELLTGRQNLVMFGRLSHLPGRAARRRGDELLDQFGLADAGDLQVKRFSGGMRRRLDLAIGMIVTPSVLFLDEPTTGLDPRARNEVWESVRRLVAEGVTVLLTTQYLEEADQLAQRITVIDRGHLVAEGSLQEVKSRLGGDRVDLVVHRAADLGAAAAIVRRTVGSEASVDVEARVVHAPLPDRLTTLSALLRALADADLDVEDLAVRRPTLDEVFLRLTSAEHEPREAEVPA